MALDDNIATEPSYNARASVSELMQSLFYTTLDGSTQSINSDNPRYVGYYADGFFDRHSIVNATGANYPAANSAVSVATKDVAYRGLLFTNPATNASLFVPFSGSRIYVGGRLESAGHEGGIWSSSTTTNSIGWSLQFTAGRTYQYDNNNFHAYGRTIRCVADN